MAQTAIRNRNPANNKNNRDQKDNKSICMDRKDRKDTIQILFINDRAESIQQIKEQLNDPDLKETDSPEKIAELPELPDLLLIRPEYLIGLEKSNQVKNKLLSMIGHDLRSPLGSIKMILDFIDQKIIDPKSDDFESTVPELMNAADDAFYLLENLLYWSRIQAGTVSYVPEKYNLKALLQKSVNQLKRFLDAKKISILDNVKGDQECWGDEFLILVILRNLLSNAGKFSHESSEIQIDLENSGDSIKIFFKDSGVGIAKENMSKLFDPYTLFHTYGTNNETGNGLGLKVSNELARINKGNISLVSKEGKGTTACLSLPIMDPTVNS